MSDNKNFDEYIEKLEYRDEIISHDSRKNILDSTRKKIENDSKTITNKRNNRKRTVSYAAAACIAMILLSGLIPSTPIFALYQSVFQFIPGVGVVKTEEDTSIYLATDQAYKLEEEEGFLEVKYAYASGNSLNISIVTDIPFASLNLKSKEDILKEVAGENELGLYLYLIIDNKKIYLNNYSMSGPSSLTGVVKIEGAVEIEKKIENKTIVIGMDRIINQLEVQMTNVQENVLPSVLGKTLNIDDFLIFADFKRYEDISVLSLSSVLPEEYMNFRAYLFEDEKEIFDSGIYILDDSGNSYFPNDELREANNDSINNFYFNIPANVTGLILKIPQIFYDTGIIGQMKVKMPKNGDSIAVNASYSIGDMQIHFDSLSFVSVNDDEIVSKEFGEETLRLDFSTATEGKSDHRVYRIMPNIKVKEGFRYVGVSSHGYAAYWNEMNQSGEYYTVFDDMKDTKKILVEIKVCNVIYGPFEIELD